ncbi:MAG: flagellin FliC [Bdellovibrio sp.]|nr:flagellin FliC [Bdellovibrio sp.]
MGVRISTNVQSLVAQRHLGINSAHQKDSLEHLASGSRINKAADDAAGLAISEKMRGMVRSIRQDVRNASDGISMIQTAEGGMNEIGNILTRFRELAIQAASDTLGDEERGFIDKEVQQMKQEITRISTSTEYNGRKLLNGEGESLDIQVGAHNRPLEDRFVFDTSKANASLDHLNLGSLSVLDKESARESLDTIDESVKLLVENRAELGALQNRLQSAVTSLNIYDENMSSGMSRIRDTDMAAETAELAKNNILTTAGVSVLSQANTNNMLALKLLS